MYCQAAKHNQATNTEIEHCYQQMGIQHLSDTLHSEFATDQCQIVLSHSFDLNQLDIFEYVVPLTIV